jgi:muramoyltetrapeptide carboxypeptidase
MTKKPSFGVCAPSSYAETNNLNAGIERLRSLGHNVIVHPQAYGRLANTQLAGKVSEKIAALYDLMADPKVDIIMPATGGQTSAHMLDQIDFRRLTKPIMGYSDTTTLVNAAYAQTGTIQYHGPHAATARPGRYSDDDYQQMLSLLQGATSIPLPGAITQNPGTGTGRLIGGNLVVFQHLLHTPWCPPLDNAILFFEDIGDELTSIDRTLNYFRLLGLFDRAAGIIFGQFTDMKDTGRPFGFTMDEIIATHTRTAPCPVVTHAPFGHDGMLVTFPVGAHATLTAGPGTPRLVLEK